MLFFILYFIVFVHSGIIINHGYTHISAALYSNTKIKLLLDSNGNRNQPSFVNYRCKHHDYVFGYQASAIIGSQTVNQIQPFYKEMDTTLKTCQPPHSFTSILSFQMNKLYFKKDHIHQKVSLQTLATNDTINPTYILVPFNFSPYEMEEIQWILPNTKFIPYHKQHASMIVNAVNKQIVSPAEEYVVIECGASSTRITTVKMLDMNYNISNHIVLDVNVNQLNKLLADSIGHVENGVSRQSYMKQINDLRVRLSSNQQIHMFIDDLDKNVTITRQQYHQIIQAPIQTLSDAFKQIKNTLSTNSTVFLVGGLSYTPMVKELVQTIFGSYSIRLAGDEFLFDSIKLFITYNTMINPPFTITDLVPLDIDMHINNNTIPLITKTHRLNTTQYYNIPLPKTNSICFTDHSNNKTLRQFNITNMNSTNSFSFQFNTMENGLLTHLSIPNASITLVPLHNQTQIVNEIQQYQLEEEKKLQTENDLMEKRVEFETLLLEFKRYILSDVDDLINVQQLLDSTEKKSFDSIVEHITSFKQKHNTEINMYEEYNNYTKHIEMMEHEAFDVLMKIKEIRLKEYNTWTEQFKTTLQMKKESKNDRDLFEKKLEQFIQSMNNRIHSITMFESFKWVYKVGGIVICILIMVIVYKVSTKKKANKKKKH
ncbi:Uncharacterized protein QTN25_002675 [Entamoeba marina]